jgi:hypothetical protein
MAVPKVSMALSDVKLAMRKDLERSGLNERDAAALKLVAVTKDMLITNYPDLTQAPAAGYLIPYFNVAGKDTGFYRFRYLEEPPRTGFAALVTHKQIRYLQPRDTLPAVYFAPVGFDWREIIKDPSVSLYITEGEKKAAKASIIGAATLGLGGVWSFKSKKKNLGLIPDLKQINWNGRKTYLCFDSDAAENPDVLIAENALARAVLEEGAEVYIIRLQPDEEGNKVGLDDLLTRKGGEETFAGYVGQAEEWAASKEFHALNDEVTVVLDPGCILRLENKQRMSDSTFTRIVYADRKYMLQTGSGKNMKSVERPAAKDWLQWNYRSKVERITYLPGQPRWTTNNELNMWPGWGIEERHFKKGDTSLWRTLLKHLFNTGEGPDPLSWFLSWLAYPLQHPGTKMFTAAIIWGRLQGTGKTLIGHTMARLYGENFAEISNRELDWSFNEWAENKQFVLADEIAGGDKRAIADYLKGLITQKQLRINPKHVKPYVVPDCINYLFTSNHSDSFFMEDPDRRYFVHEVKTGPLEPAFYKEYDKWYKSDAVGALGYELFHYDVGDFNPTAAAPITRAKLAMIEDGRSDAAAWVATLREDPERVLRISAGAPPIGWSLMTTEEIFRCFDWNGTGKLTKPGLVRELKRGGFVKVNLGEPVKTRLSGAQRLWAVRNTEALLNGMNKHDRLAHIYDKERSSPIDHLIPREKY